MRIPIILAFIVIITLPKDVHGLVEDVSTQVRTASATFTGFFDRSDDPVQVAETRADANVPKVMTFSVR